MLIDYFPVSRGETSFTVEVFFCYNAGFQLMKFIYLLHLTLILDLTKGSSSIELQIMTQFLLGFTKGGFNEEEEETEEGAVKL